MDERRGDRAERIDLVEEHMASRKEWGRYVRVITAIHRSDIARNAEFLVRIRAALERTRRIAGR